VSHVVAVNGSFLIKPVAGVQRYAHENMRAFRRLGIEDLLILAPHGYSEDEYCGYKVIRDNLPWQHRLMWLWEQVRLPYLLRKTDVRLLWSPANTGPVLVRRQVVTIHDASVFANPAWFSFALRTIYRFILPALGRAAAGVLTDSEFSKSELIKHKVAPERKISVVPCGVGAEFSDAITSPGGEGFVLCVGSRDPRKNVPRLVRAWQLMDKEAKRGMKLLVAGGGGRMFAQEFLGEAPEDVEFLGYVNEEELIDLYRRAVLFVYPSLYEGFGLPPLEAMACGTPVITSSVSSLPEVVGDAAMLVDPYDVEEISGAIQKLLADQELQGELKKRGLERSSRFTWERTAEFTWKAIEEAYELV
jgi:glycosyltransferase involved in cell wall biosynthesis